MEKASNERSDQSPTPTSPVSLVVGVGASAGGLDAFKQLLGVLPADSGMAFLLVQHLDPTHRSLLTELLAPCTSMPVMDADQGMELRPNTIYIIRPDTALAVKNGKIELSTPQLHRGVRLPVDHLFRSLAHNYGSRAAGIVLSGAGSDGSSGLRDLKSAGGLTVAQNPDNSAQTGMPQSAIDTGMVDLVLDINQIPAALQRFSNLPPSAQLETASPAREQDETSEPLKNLDEAELGRLAALLEAHMNFDLRVYKLGTIERRVLRRMTLSGFESIDDYFDHLRQDGSERQTLVRDLLISVTDFFRDLDAFKALREMVIHPLVAEAANGAELRVWVPGCATGEEAYSMGMEFLDAIDSQNKRLNLQIFATDIDQEALAFARAAFYPPSIADRVSKSRLDNYFRAMDGKGYQVRPLLRDVISFAAHDLTKDPPFSRMNLVSCRNVLIYLTNDAQKHVLKVLHFALQPEGHLMLSTSESTGPQRELFSTISKAQRIYRKVGSSRPIAVARSRTRMPAPERGNGGSEHEAKDNTTAKNSGHDLARKAILTAWVPPTIVVADDGTVLFMHGDLGRYLRFPEGDNPRLDLTSILRPEIATRARGALYKCRRDKNPVVAHSSPDVETKGQTIRITANPAATLGDEVVMLTFETESSQAVAAAESQRSESPGQDAVIEQLEKELQATREDLRNTVEELETSNEELRSSNEESMSMNEELQSANEELEATTEELRSLNEELTTVNAQLREKVEQLEHAHDDLQNFFSSTKMATLFLDEQLCVKRFTPAAQELLAIDYADIGRCVNDMARDLLQNGLDKEAKEVLEHFSPQSQELKSEDGRWIVRQVLPYRTENRRIEGVVITFADVSELREVNENLQVKSRRLELAWEAARGGIFEYRVPLDETTFHSEQWAQILGYRCDELPAYDQFLSWLNDQIHPDDQTLVNSTYENFISGQSDRYHVEMRLRHRRGHWLWVRGISKALARESDGSVKHVLGMMIDVTDLKQVEEALRESESRFREMTDGLPLIVWVHDSRGDQEYVNTTYCEFFGVDREDMQGNRWQALLHPDDLAYYNAEFLACIQDKRLFHCEARVKHADGSWRWLESWGQPRFTPSSEFRGMVGTSVDMTERRQLEDTMRESEERFRTLADNIAQLAWMAQGDGAAFWFNKRWYDYTGASFDDMKGWGWRSFHHPKHANRVMARIRRGVRTSKGWEATFPLRNCNGDYRWFLSRSVPILDGEGQVVRWFGTATDVTNQRAIEEQLVEADRQKDVFLAMLGHELRNPLGAIRNTAELLKDENKKTDNPSLKRIEAVLERQTAHIAKLLDGLLDVSRIIRGKIKLDVTTLDFAAVCRDVAADTDRYNSEGLAPLKLDLPKSVWVKGDPIRLAQVVDNLLSNARKYTPAKGLITISLRKKGKQAVLRIQDTGIGIEASLLPHVFGIFRQSEQSIDRAYGGLGLGLALVKSIVELHGGKVEAKSDGKDKGTEVTVRLPTTTQPQASSASKSVNWRKSSNILLIEDNKDAAETLRLVLELSGHRATVARTGKEGLLMAEQLDPDVILCDLGLPDGMSGFDVARQLSKQRSERLTQLIAVSGYGRPEDKKNALRAGFDAHLTKPVSLNDLTAVLDKLGEVN